MSNLLVFPSALDRQMMKLYLPLVYLVGAFVIAPLEISVMPMWLVVVLAGTALGFMAAVRFSLDQIPDLFFFISGDNFIVKPVVFITGIWIALCIALVFLGFLSHGVPVVPQVLFKAFNAGIIWFVAPGVSFYLGVLYRRVVDK